MAPHDPAVEETGEDDKRLITVLVIGFGPFQSGYPRNPSYEIAKSLPQLLPQTPIHRKTIRVIAYPSPVRVCYQDVRELIPEVLQSHANSIDLVLLMGMASGRKFYAAEQYARRDGYGKHRDVDGKLPALDEGETRFGDCPPIMTTSLEFDGLVRRWQDIVRDTPVGSAAHGADCRPSDDAGRYLCDYSYFNSLAWFGRRNGKTKGGTRSDRPVLFFHVPAESDEESLETGRAVAVALIRAMSENLVESPPAGESVTAL